MVKKYFHIALALIALSSPFSRLYADESDEQWTVERAVPKQWTNYNLSDVRLMDGSVFKTRQDQHRKYLLSLSEERLINNVMRAAGMATTAENYGGWQHNNGNGFGNYMSGCSMMYAATGDEELLKRVKWMIDIISICQEQENLGGWFHYSRTRGYYNELMGAATADVYPQNNGEDFYTNAAMAGMDFYQIHRIGYGIRDVYYYTGYEKARTAFIRYMEWCCTWTELFKNDERLQMALEAEHGGMTELFMDAYALTGNDRFLENGKRWIQTLNFRDKMAVGEDVLVSRHANVYAPKFMGLIREYELTGDEVNRNAALNTWDFVIHRHTQPLGGAGRWERFGQQGRQLDELANTSSETCGTNNMMRFTKTMFSIFGTPKYMDYYERALYNHILASKDPDNNTIGGGFCYYQSLLPGMNRKYMNDNSFYCCWETALENHSKYGEAIYFHNDDDILVNLYIPSTLSDSRYGFTMTMKGDYPNDNVLTYTIDKNQHFAGHLCFRIPAWMDADKVVVTVNGNTTALKSSDTGFPYLDHTLQVGDVITLTMPLELRYEPSEEPDMAAVFYGPLLLSPDMGHRGGDYASDVWIQTETKTPEQFPEFKGSKEHLSDWMTRDGHSLYFKTNAINQTYTFLPFYQANHMATSIWQRFTGDEDMAVAHKYVTDHIDIGWDEKHDFSGRSSIGSIYNRHFLHVMSKNRVQYTMSLSPEAGMQHYVALQYDGWETDTLGCTSVYVDDVYIGELGPCEKAQQFTFPHAFFKIPLELTEGKSSVRLKLQQGARAMNFFGIEIVTERYLQEMCPETRWTYQSEPATIHLEAEAAQPHESNRAFDGKSAGGAYISRLSTYLQWNSIYIPRSGDYDLCICRRGTGSVNYTLRVNNVSTEVKITKTSSGSTWEPFTIRIHLDAGFSTIYLSPKSYRTPFDIDYIELVPINDDSVSKVRLTDTSFYVYPNPASSMVTFKVSEEVSGEIRIYDMQGRLMDHFRYPEHATYDVTGLPDGIYQIILANKRTSYDTKMIVKK